MTCEVLAIEYSHVTQKTFWLEIQYSKVLLSILIMHKCVVTCMQIILSSIMCESIHKFVNALESFSFSVECLKSRFRE